MENRTKNATNQDAQELPRHIDDVDAAELIKGGDGPNHEEGFNIVWGLVIEEEEEPTPA